MQAEGDLKKEKKTKRIEFILSWSKTISRAVTVSPHAVV